MVQEVCKRNRKATFKMSTVCENLRANEEGEKGSKLSASLFSCALAPLQSGTAPHFRN
jgi:hypothetical protein